MEKVNIFTEEQLLAVIERAFKQGWRMRMNRKNGEMDDVLEDYLTIVKEEGLETFFFGASQSKVGLRPNPGCLPTGGFHPRNP